MGRNATIDGEAALGCLVCVNTDGADEQRALFDRIRQARSDANFQLYYGPSARESCDLSWEAAIDILREFWRDCGQDLWVSSDDHCDVWLQQPQYLDADDDGEYGPDDSYWQVDASDVGRAVFGNDLFQYIR